jgi:hypothetical protein
MVNINLNDPKNMEIDFLRKLVEDLNATATRQGHMATKFSMPAKALYEGSAKSAREQAQYWTTFIEWLIQE